MYSKDSMVDARYLRQPIGKGLKDQLKQGCGSGSAFIFPPGSGSGSRSEKCQVKKKKKCKDIGKNCNLIQFFKVNLQGPVFFTFEHSFMFFTTTKTLHKVNCDKLFKAGSGSALKKIAGSGSAKNECGSKAMTSTGIVFFLLKFIHVTDTHGISCG